MDTCTKIQQHIRICNNCKSKLDYDPNEKALQKSYSMKNDVMELLVYIVSGIIIIFILNLIVELKIRDRVK